MTILIENRSDDEKEITSYLEIFFAHVIKYKVLKNIRSKRWINTINNCLNNLSKIKLKNPASFKGYVLKDHLDTIKKEALKIAINDNRDKNPNIFNINEPYQKFDSLDKILNIELVYSYIEYDGR